MTFSRRDFLLRTTGFVTVSAMVPRWAVAGAARFEESVAAADTGRTLVVLELMGGNDGLNTVVPYADALYPSLRARIGIPVDSVLHLDGALGLNPVMTGMKALWDAQRVAVVSNVGYPNSSLSHFSARDVWHTADPLLAERRGWLGRWADDTLAGTGNPLSCAAISQSLPKTLLADHVGVPTFLNLASYQYQTDGAFPADGANQVTAFLAGSGADYGSGRRRDGARQGRPGCHFVLRHPPDGRQWIRRDGRLSVEQPRRGPAADRRDHPRGPGRPDPLRHGRRFRQSLRRRRRPRPAARRRLRLDQGLLRRPGRPRQVEGRAAHDVVRVRPARPGQRLERHRSRNGRAALRRRRRRDPRASTAARRSSGTWTPTGT